MLFSSINEPACLVYSGESEFSIIEMCFENELTRLHMGVQGVAWLLISGRAGALRLAASAFIIAFVCKIYASDWSVLTFAPYPSLEGRREACEVVDVREKYITQCET